MKIFLIVSFLSFNAFSQGTASYDPKLFSIFKSYEKNLGSRDKLIEKFQVWESNGFNMNVDYILGNGVNTYIEESCEYENTLVFLITPHSGNYYVGGMTLKDYNSSVWALQNMEFKPENIKSETHKECKKDEILVKTANKRPDLFSEDDVLKLNLGIIGVIREISRKLMNSSDSDSFYYCYDKNKLRNTILAHKVSKIPHTPCPEVLGSEMDKVYEVEDPETRLKHPNSRVMMEH